MLLRPLDPWSPLIPAARFGIISNEVHGYTVGQLGTTGHQRTNLVFGGQGGFVYDLSRRPETVAEFWE